MLCPGFFVAPLASNRQLKNSEKFSERNSFMLRHSLAVTCAVLLIAAPAVAMAQSEISYADTMRKQGRSTSSIHKVSEGKAGGPHAKGTGKTSAKKSHRGRV